MEQFFDPIEVNQAKYNKHVQVSKKKKKTKKKKKKEKKKKKTRSMFTKNLIICVNFKINLN